VAERLPRVRGHSGARGAQRVGTGAELQVGVAGDAVRPVVVGIELDRVARRRQRTVVVAGSQQSQGEQAVGAGALRIARDQIAQRDGRVAVAAHLHERLGAAQLAHARRLARMYSSRSS
jgi:hypothetical protein